MATTTVADIKAGTASAPSRRTIFDLLDDPRMQKAITAVAGQFFTADRFLRLAINAVRKTPKLAQCDPQSVLGAFMAAAALGLEPNTVQQQAFLIPYDKRGKLPNGQWGVVGTECQFQIGYRGFITLAHRSPHIDSIQAEAIHEGDLFDHMMGSESFLKYRKALRERGDLIGSFCHTKLASGVELATVLPLEEIHKIRGRSETYNALVRSIDNARDQKEKNKAVQKLEETPWVMWEDDMAAKSAIKKHAKQLPLTPGDAIAAATELDDDSRTIDMAAMADPDVARGVVQDGYAPPERAEDEAPLQLEQDTPAIIIPHQATQPEREPVARQPAQAAAQQHRMERDESPELGDEPPPWVPSEAEQAAIRERELAEAQQQQTAPAARTRNRNLTLE